MKLSGHSYDNSVFDSLLDGLSDDVVLKKTAAKQQPEDVAGMHVFSSTTEEDLRSIQQDELEFIASELQFAADNAKVAVTKEDLVKFAHQVQAEGLRGKSMERAARRYCTNLNRSVAAPEGTTRRSSSLLDQLHGSAVVPAGYNPEIGPNNTKTGGYLGMSKNPNSIFDSGKLAHLAEKPEDRTDMYGDEQIKESKKANKDYRTAMKDGEWQEKQDQLSDPDMLHNKVASIHTGKETGTHQALPQNAMSMFGEDRDFSNIPEQTQGEMLKEAANKRASKSADAKEEWNKVEPAKKANNTMPAFFAGDTQQVDTNTKSQRSAMDQIFESLLNQSGN